MHDPDQVIMCERQKAKNKREKRLAVGINNMLSIRIVHAGKMKQACIVFYMVNVSVIVFKRIGRNA